jgi:hypothetical protein
MYFWSLGTAYAQNAPTTLRPDGTLTEGNRCRSQIGGSAIAVTLDVEKTTDHRSAGARELVQLCTNGRKRKTSDLYHRARS